MPHNRELRHDVARGEIMQAVQPSEWDGSGFSLYWLARQRPGPVAASLSFGTLVLYLGVHALNGTFFALGQGGAATSVARMDFVFAVLLVYSAAIGVGMVRALGRDMDVLSEIVQGGKEETDRLADRLLHVRPVRLGVALGLGALLGASIAAFAQGPAADRLVLGVAGNALHVGLEIALFMLLGFLALIGLEHSKALADLGRSRCSVELFHEEPRKVFARSGMRVALAWTGGSGISLVLLLDTTHPPVVVGVLLLAMGMGILSLFMSCRGIRQAIREEKARSLVEIRRRLREEMKVFGASSAQSPQPSQALASLVAAEARVEAVADWPLDSALARRFGLILLVPLLSWTGGALVERLVDSFFG